LSEQETEEVEEALVEKGKKKAKAAKQTMTMKEFLADAQRRGIVLASASTSCPFLRFWIIYL
jgi:hypothetical protein